MAGLKDSGWPIDGAIQVNLAAHPGVLISPETLFDANEARWLLVTAAVSGNVHSLKAQFEPFDANDITPIPRWGPGSQKPVKTMIGPIDFAVQPDGKVHEYRVDLSHEPRYSGRMMRVRILIPAGSGTVRIEALSLGAKANVKAIAARPSH